MTQKNNNLPKGTKTEKCNSDEYSRGYRDGYLRGIEDTRRGLTETNMEIKILDVPLQGVGLSVRAQRCLWRAGCTTLRDVIALQEGSIRTMRNLGAVTAKEITQLLNDNGIHFTAWDKILF